MTSSAYSLSLYLNSSFRSVSNLVDHLQWSRGGADNDNADGRSALAQNASLWTQQSNRGYTTDIPGDDFWQHNIYAGYRFLGRRAEARVGLLNIVQTPILYFGAIASNARGPASPRQRLDTADAMLSSARLIRLLCVPRFIRIRPAPPVP